MEEIATQAHRSTEFALDLALRTSIKHCRIKHIPGMTSVVTRCGSSMLHWNEVNFDIPNLDDLLAKYRQHGGAIIQYDRITSAIVYTRRTAVYEWVPGRAARWRAGLKHALWCAMFGWWSWTGLIVTGILIFNNALGGLDFTRLLTAPPPLPGSHHDP